MNKYTYGINGAIAKDGSASVDYSTDVDMSYAEARKLAAHILVDNADDIAHVVICRAMDGVVDGWREDIAYDPYVLSCVEHVITIQSKNSNGVECELLCDDKDALAWTPEHNIAKCGDDYLECWAAMETIIEGHYVEFVKNEITGYYELVIDGYEVDLDKVHIYVGGTSDADEVSLDTLIEDTLRLDVDFKSIMDEAKAEEE